MSPFDFFGFRLFVPRIFGGSLPASCAEVLPSPGPRVTLKITPYLVLPPYNIPPQCLSFCNLPLVSLTTLSFFFPLDTRSFPSLLSRVSLRDSHSYLFSFCPTYWFLSFSVFVHEPVSFFFFLQPYLPLSPFSPLC